MRKNGGYEPFGSLLPGRNYNSSSYNFGFGGQLKDDEVFGVTGTSYTAEFWQYDPRVGRRWNLDPLSPKFPAMAPYAGFNDNPLLYKDPGGNEAVNTNDGGDGGDDVDPAGYYAANKSPRTAAFFLRHPVAGPAIGEVQKGSVNISTVATRFAASTGALQENDMHEGSEVNAFRHTLWQGMITQQFGDGIAAQAGNAHEENPRALYGLTNPVSSTFTSLSAADETIDLLNNQIGRQIGRDNSGASPQQLALKTLDAFQSTGLWVATENANGTYGIAQITITNAQYTTAKTDIMSRNDYGFTAAQWNSRMESSRQWLQSQRTIPFGGNK
jgi:hypothetical protein